MPWPIRLGPPPRIMILLAVGRIRLAFLVVGRVHVRGRRRELRGTGIDALVDGADSHGQTATTHAGFVDAEQRGEPAIGKALALECAHAIAFERGEALLAHRLLFPHQILDLRQEPRIDARQRMHFVELESGAEGISDVANPVRSGHAQLPRAADAAYPRPMAARATDRVRRCRLPGCAAPSAAIPGRFGRSP